MKETPHNATHLHDCGDFSSTPTGNTIFLAASVMQAFYNPLFFRYSILLLLLGVERKEKKKLVLPALVYLGIVIVVY